MIWLPGSRSSSANVPGPRRCTRCNGGVLYPGAEDVMAINRAIANGNCCAAPPKREKCQTILREQAKRDLKRAEELFRRASEAERVAVQIDRMPPAIEGLIAEYSSMAIGNNSMRSAMEAFIR